MVILFWKHSNLCDHDTPASQTDRQTDNFAVAIPCSM